jgi:hypothetical protein
MDSELASSFSFSTSSQHVPNHFSCLLACYKLAAIYSYWSSASAIKPTIGIRAASI